MKKFLPSLALLFVFFQVFAFSAEKISSPPAIPPKIVANVNPEIVPGSSELSSTVLVIRSDARFPSPEVRFSCENRKISLGSVMLPNNERIEVASITFSSDCSEITATLAQSGQPENVARFVTSSQDRLFSSLADLSDEALFLFIRDTRESIQRLSLMTAEVKAESKPETLSGSILSQKLRTLGISYRVKALHRRIKIAEAIANERATLSYLVPIAGKTLPSQASFIPWAGRPYRKGVTDGIHHGWDIFAPVGTPVRAIANGIIIRVVSDFSWESFSQIQKDPKNPDHLAQNLDVYRGNQVWLKTADGNVTFYSHLQDIPLGITPGVSVVAGQILGTVGVTGVPDKDYRNPHLHFEIQKNPHNGTDSVDPLSIMRWEYLGKGFSKKALNEMITRMFR